MTLLDRKHSQTSPGATIKRPSLSHRLQLLFEKFNEPGPGDFRKLFKTSGSKEIQDLVLKIASVSAFLKNDHDRWATDEN